MTTLCDTPKHGRPNLLKPKLSSQMWEKRNQDESGFNQQQQKQQRSSGRSSRRSKQH
jgi:hypothetical protein